MFIDTVKSRTIPRKGLELWPVAALVDDNARLHEYIKRLKLCNDLAIALENKTTNVDDLFKGHHA